ncbi:MAG: 3-isopropylmalate dehydrogenase [Chloroflexota bacterium]
MGRDYRIGVIAGDGIGPEVVREGLAVLDRVARREGFRYQIHEFPWSSDHYLETGRLMSADALDEMRTLDAIYLGALGDPRVERGLVERSVIMTLRLGLDLYINLRPIVLYTERICPLKGINPADVDMVVVRENTEDAYVGVGGVVYAGTPREIAMAEMIYTRYGVERAIRFAFNLARCRDKQRKVTLVDKSNAIRAQEIWRRTFSEVALDYPDVSADAVYVDAAAMYMITEPSRFDVIVTSNLFGDILTDLGAAVQGGPGSAASGNIHPGQLSMFEPVHGSAPDIAGRGTASPVGAILALAMMLDHLGEASAARSIEASVRDVLHDGRLRSLDAESGLSTSEVGELIAGALGRQTPISAIVAEGVQTS